VQADLEAELANLCNGLFESVLQRRLAAAEDDRSQQPSAAAQKAHHGGPFQLVTAVAGNQVGVVAIPAAPGAALAEHHCGQATREIGTGQRCKAADLQV